jgi:flagellar protein FlaG
MSETINTATNAATAGVPVASSRSAQLTRATDVPSRPKDNLEVKEPDIKIAELATKVSVDKEESVQSLDEMAHELRDAISALNTALAKTPTSAIITRDEALNRYIVRIADETSGEIVREIPSEALLKFARNLQELKGIIFDETT